MKKYIVIIYAIALSLFGLTSCLGQPILEVGVSQNSIHRNIVVRDNVCYIYDSNPSQVLLNSLHVIDGRYYYHHNNQYVNVVFPNWRVWSNDRYFFYERNRWQWRDRHNYHHYHRRQNHNQFMIPQHYNNHRRPNHFNNQYRNGRHPRPMQNNHNRGGYRHSR